MAIKTLKQARKKLPKVVRRLFEIDVMINDEEHAVDAFADLMIYDPITQLKDGAVRYFFIEELKNMAEINFDTMKEEFEAWWAKKDMFIRSTGVRGETKIRREIIRDPRYFTKKSKVIKAKRQFLALKSYCLALNMHITSIQSIIKVGASKEEIRRMVHEIMENK